MLVSPRFQQFKTFTQFVGKARRVVSMDRQPAAFFRAIDCKRPADGMTAGLDDLFHPRDVGRTVRWIGQKMEGCSIMPNVEGLRRVPSGYVRDDPLYLARAFTEPRLGSFQGCLGNIQHRDTVEATRDKAIDQT